MTALTESPARAVTIEWMRTRLIVLLLASACLTACNSTQPAAAAPSSAASQPATPAASQPVPAAASPNDAVASKLAELAGSGATACGRIKALSGPELKTAADCALQAAHEKRAFTVAYDMPGLTVAVAGNAQGKLFSVSASPDASGAIAPAGIKTTECPSELRAAQSGRVTCFPPGSMGLGSSGANPHGAVPPAKPGTPNPHGTVLPKAYPKTQ